MTPPCSIILHHWKKHSPTELSIHQGGCGMGHMCCKFASVIYIPSTHVYILFLPLLFAYYFHTAHNLSISTPNSHSQFTNFILLVHFIITHTFTFILHQFPNHILLRMPLHVHCFSTPPHTLLYIWGPLVKKGKNLSRQNVFKAGLYSWRPELLTGAEWGLIFHLIDAGQMTSYASWVFQGISLYVIFLLTGSPHLFCLHLPNLPLSPSTMLKAFTYSNLPHWCF